MTPAPRHSGKGTALATERTRRGQGPSREQDFCGSGAGPRGSGRWAQATIRTSGAVERTARRLSPRGDWALGGRGRVRGDPSVPTPAPLWRGCCRGGRQGGASLCRDGVDGNSVLSAQWCREPKTGLKNQVHCKKRCLSEAFQT